MSFLTDYFSKQQFYQNKYGPRTVVLIEKGTFYEIYEYDYDKSEDQDSRYPDGVGHSREISFIINMVLTSLSKGKPHTISNPYMVGFPSVSYERNRNLIVSNYYTIIRIDQKSGDPTQREVAEITSIGTELEPMFPGININSSSNCILSIYIECKITVGRKTRNHIDDFGIIAGLSLINIVTGENVVAEVYSQDNNNIYAVQEIYRFLAAHRPLEVIFNLKTLSGKIPDCELENYVSLLYDLLELNKYNVIGPKINQIENEYFSLNFQQQFLTRVFYPNSSPTQIQNMSELSKQSADAVASSPTYVSSNNIPSTNTKFIGNIIEELNIERMSYGLISYILLLKYCYEHNEDILKKISKPSTEWTDQSKHLILSNNAINQLDILPSQNISSVGMSNRGKRKKIDSLISVLDGTSTPGGKRLLHKMLVSPITNPKILNNFYDCIEEMISCPDMIKVINSKLKQVSDLDKLHRKINLSNVTPRELYILYNSYIRITEIFQVIITNSYDDGKPKNLNLLRIFPSNEKIESFNRCLFYLSQTIDFEKLNACKILRGKLESRIDSDESFIIRGNDPTLDQLDSNIRTCKDVLNKICTHLDNIISPSGISNVKIKYVRKGKVIPSIQRYDNIDVILITAQGKANILKRNLSRVDILLCGNLEFTKVTKGIIISSEIISSYLDCLISSKSVLELRLYIIYQQIIDKLSVEYDYQSSISESISKIDYIKTNATNALQYNYFRPIIDNSNLNEGNILQNEEGDPTNPPEDSYLSIKNGRHPIIERIISTEYISNDLDLGTGNRRSPYGDHSDNDLGTNNLGMLLYGINSSGKSSLAKSVGLIIVMAQAGMFVPAELRYRPYYQISTRLSGNDDIFKGMSSFVVEMTELRNILRNATPNTLVLGDELCRGTESISGTSLTIATIEHLISTKTSFIFSTHMHHLPSHPNISKLSEKELRLCHLSTYYDETIGDLVYDRKLEDGPGNSVYGLEVCRSLSMDSKFITRANEIRRNLSGNESILNPKKSRYNSLIYTDVCSLCGIKSNVENTQIDTHHIKEQNTADANGMIDTYHKNTSFNLIALCSKCHHSLHDSKLKLTPTQSLNKIHLKIEPDC